MSSSISIRGYRTGFFFVVVLLASATGFTLFGELRTNARVDDLVYQSLRRDDLIGRIRVDALALEAAVNEHIDATDDDDRAFADTQMEEILADAREAREEYTRDLPDGEKDAWRRFDETARALAQQVRTAVKYSNRKQAERARQHLEDEIKPVRLKLNQLAAELSKKNAEEATRLVNHREDLRSRTTLISVVGSLIAIFVSLLVGVRVMSTLRKQERTIQEQLVELNRRNRELDSFASRVAHDLISPLSPLKGYLTLIRRSGSIEDASVLEMVTLAESSATRMAGLVEALLRFCRAGTGNQGERVWGELDTAVTTILLEVDQVATLQHVQLERNVRAEVLVPCPPQLLQSIAQNLLSNAVKYTAGRRDAKVSVRVAMENGVAVLEVKDNGLGMSLESQRSLFQPFFRAPEARGFPGHGLGLATTKRLVESHEGTILVESALDVGTTFTVRFPLAAETLAAPVKTPVAPVPAPLPVEVG